MSAVYSIFTSPHHPPVPDHLPTLIVTPHGRPQQVLYTFLHTNVNTENYLLTPAPEGDLCVAKLYPPDSSGSLRGAGGGGASSSGHGAAAAPSVRCEAGRGLGWRVVQTGIQNPVYKILLPNPDMPGEDQPLFQVSKPNPNATFWTLTYFAYAGHLIPPKRVEFGRISKNGPEQGGGTRLAITGRNDEEKAVWASLGSGNEDAVEWLVVCAALVVLDDEIVFAAGAAAGGKLRSRPPSPQKRAAGSGAMRVVAPVEMQSGVPRSASSSNLVPAEAAPPNVSRGPSPNGQVHSGPDPRFMPPPHGHPQQQHGGPHPHPPQQQRMSPPHPQQQHAPPPPSPSHQQQQQYYQQQQQQPRQPQQASRPPPSGLPQPPPRSYAPPPRTSSVPPPPHGQGYAQAPPGPPPGQSRQPSGYRPGARPGPPMQAPPPMPMPQGAGGGGEWAQAQRVKESDGQRRLVKERHR
ncbi:hypothetical protein JCM8208_007253 [Rhodotorula glutinis]